MQVQCAHWLTACSSTATWPAPAAATPPTSSSLPTGPFPLGTYSFETFLANVTTDCVSKSNDWQCAPYHTYAESPSEAGLTFQWIIADPNNDLSNLAISSPNNPFAIYFANTSLTLVDAGQETERYTYNASFDKVVTSLGVYCYFNNTRFDASLYTKRPRVYPSKASNPSPQSPTASSNPPSSPPVPFGNWDYAVDIKHSLGGGTTVQDC